MGHPEGIDDRTAAVLALTQVGGLSWSKLSQRLFEHEDPIATLHDVLGAGLFADMVDNALSDARALAESFGARGIRTFSAYSRDYPGQLLASHDAPPLIFVRGQVDTDDRFGVSVVGTRNPSRGAEVFVEEVVPLLASNKIPVVSGIARGIDALAMRTSLELGNRTVGVIGSGHDHIYPAENADIYSNLNAAGAVISQFLPASPPTQKTFPMRNRVMSGYSAATLIVEASEHSGTRSQATAAVSQGRPLIVTAAVAERTEWGRTLTHENRSVRVVSTAQEAIEAIREIHDDMRHFESRFVGQLAG
jgi:DNA processing protein